MTEQEFWEWCGWEWLDDLRCWKSPDSDRVQLRRDGIFRIPITLDNLFKYAVPEIRRRKLWLEFVKTGIIDYIWADEVDPAQALYKVICEVIENDRARA